MAKAAKKTAKKGPRSSTARKKLTSRFPKEVWDILEHEYQFGGHSSLAKAYEAVKQTIVEKFGRVPSFVSVEKRASNDGWYDKIVKTGVAVEKSTRQKLLDYAAEIGFKADRVVLNCLGDMIEATKIHIVRDKNAQDGDAKGFAEISPDYQARDKAVGHLAKIFELNGSEKIEQVGEAVTAINVNWQQSSKKGESDEQQSSEKK